MTDVLPTGAPVIVLSAPRSGSTLVRLLLDQHPDLIAPGETALARTCAAARDTWAALRLVRPAAERDAAIRISAEVPFLTLLRSTRTRRWCDKSLDNVIHADLLASIFPDAQFISLTRHPLDFVASALDATPWGYSSFGFIEYVRRSPGNVVEAVLNAWIEKVEMQLSFASRYPNRIFQLRYEDLITNHRHELRRLSSFLNLNPPLSDSPTYVAIPAADGVGDYKAMFEGSIHARSIGAGRQIPTNVIPPESLFKVNELIENLGYDPVDENWNHSKPAHVADCTHRDDAPNGCLRYLVADLTEVPRMGSKRAVTMLLTDVGCRATVDIQKLEWSFSRPDIDSHTTLTTERRFLTAVVEGEDNLGAAIRRGRIRIAGSLQDAERLLQIIGWRREHA
jgi:protein-tyrosine sulfotransferase